MLDRCLIDRYATVNYPSPSQLGHEVPMIMALYAPNQFLTSLETLCEDRENSSGGSSFCHL